MELKFKQLVLFNYSGTTADFTIEGQTVQVKLTETEEAQLRAICFAAYEHNRQSLADAILTAQPALLMPPQAIEATYDEVY